MPAKKKYEIELTDAQWADVQKSAAARGISEDEAASLAFQALLVARFIKQRVRGVVHPFKRKKA